MHTFLLGLMLWVCADMDGAISGGVRGALIGAGVGGMVGLIVHVMKKKK